MCIGKNMVCRTIFISFLISGALAQYEVTDDMRSNFRNLLQQVCARNQAAEQTDNVMDSIMEFVSCTKGLMNPEVIYKEVEEAKQHGALDEVFRKYCVKSPQLKACISHLVDGVSPCVDSSYRQQVLNGKNATDQLLDFVCYKDGDRIAMFIAEGGPECFIQKRSKIEQCFLNAKTSIDSMDRAQMLTPEEQCSKYDELSACMVQALDACPTPTPGNMIESLLRYVRDGLPCQKQG